MKNLLFLLLIPGLSFLINLNYFIFFRKVLNRINKIYSDRTKERCEDTKKRDKLENWILDRQTEIKKRVLNTGIGDHVMDVMVPTGYGFFSPKRIYALDNLLIMNLEFNQQVKELLRRTKGHYKTKTLLSLSPLYWIEFIIFLPKKLIILAGLNDEKKISNILMNSIQLIYWIISIIFTLKKIKI